MPTAAASPDAPTDTRPAARGASIDLHRGPFIVFWELTRACDLACQHCRACARPHPHPGELTTARACDLLTDLARFERQPIVVVTGGDPMKRTDLAYLIRAGTRRGLTMTMAASATPRVTAGALDTLQDAGLSRLALSLDGADPATHDRIRGVPGIFHRTLEIADDAARLNLPLQINTTVSTTNVDQIDAIAERVEQMNAVLWSVFFLVPVGRGHRVNRISPAQYEQVFERLWHHAQRGVFAVKTTEAHHYRRYVMQQGGNPNPGRAPLGIRDGLGCMFISHTGQVQPSGFLPKQAGRFPRDSVVTVYRNSPMFRRLRDPDQLQGKCGRCEFNRVCGGSRARAFAVTGDEMAQEPDCLYQPNVN